MSRLPLTQREFEIAIEVLDEYDFHRETRIIIMTAIKNSRYNAEEWWDSYTITKDFCEQCISSRK
jgi:hypothetical protein